MTKQEFLVYLELLSSNKDHDRINDFITDDITLEFADRPYAKVPSRKILHGREEYITHFKNLHSEIREFLDLGSFFVYDGETLVVELLVEFHALKDTNLVGDLKKGEAYCATHWLVYNFAPDGRFCRVRNGHHIVHDTPPVHSPEE